MTFIARTTAVLLIFAVSRAFAANWPEDYVVCEQSESPDGQYGILIPSMDAYEKDEFVAQKNYLANLKTHKVIGLIEGGEYYQHQNHADLSVTWAKDSKVAVVTYEGRFGSDSIFLIEPTSSNFAQAEIGKHIQTAIDAVIAKQAHQRVGGYVTPLFRIEPGRKIRVYATALTNPKQLEEAKSYFALFRGLYDLPAKKWIKSQARPLTSKESDLLDRGSTSYDADKYKVSPEAFKDLNADAEEPQVVDGNACFRSEESEFKYVDDHLNEVYKAARLILSPAEFAKVQAEQREWLKKRDAAGSLAEKNKLTIARTDELQDASW